MEGDAGAAASSVDEASAVEERAAAGPPLDAMEEQGPIGSPSSAASSSSDPEAAKEALSREQDRTEAAAAEEESGISRSMSELSVSSKEIFPNLSPGSSSVQASEASASLDDGGASGYLAGSGSRSASTSGTEEIVDHGRRSGKCVSFRCNWVPGKRYPEEDDSMDSWRQHKKHFFILSNAGKPIYSRYGDEHKLAGFSAALQAIMSVVANSGDRLQVVHAGNHQFVFLVRGPLYLVSISATEEPFQALQRQLELLHGQLLLILTKTIERCFARNSNFDMKRLLGGTDIVLSSLIHSFNWNPTTFLHAYACLPLPFAARQTAGAALQDVADSAVLFALLMCGHKVINMVGPRKASLHPDDLFLLSNFISSSDSFRTTESFSPICLSNYNANAFLYAYVNYLSEDVYLVLLSTAVDSFYHLKECRTRVEAILKKSRVLHEAGRSVAAGGLLVQDVPSDNHDALKKASEKGGKLSLGNGNGHTLLGGPAGLWHFIYRSTFLDQYLASEYTPPLHTYAAQKRLFRAYQMVYYSMHDDSGGHHKMQYRRDENYVLMYWRTSDFELYAAFDPLAEKSSAIRVCNQICQWIRNMESEVFLLGATPFNW